MTSRERSRNVDGSTDLEYQAREESRPGRQPRTRRSGSARARTGGRGDGSTRRDGERLRSAVAGWYGTAATRTICRGERGGGGEDERESGTCWGEQAECPDRQETRDDRRPAGGKRRVSLGPRDEERLCLAEGGLWPGRQVADVADLAAVAAAAAAATRTGGRGTDGGRGVSAVYWSVVVCLSGTWVVAVVVVVDGRPCWIERRREEERSRRRTVGCSRGALVQSVCWACGHNPRRA